MKAPESVQSLGGAGYFSDGQSWRVARQNRLSESCIESISAMKAKPFKYLIIDITLLFLVIFIYHEMWIAIAVWKTNFLGFFKDDPQLQYIKWSWVLIV